MKAQDTGGDKWDQLILPALAEPRRTESGEPILLDDGSVPGDPLRRKPGEALAPGRKTATELTRIKNAVGERTWSALFQQQPISTEGATFREEWFKPIDRLAPQRKKIRAWDLGSTKTGDYTAGVLMSRDKDGQFYIEDVIRFRGTPLEVEKVIFQTARNDGRSVGIRIPQDPGQAGLAQSKSFIRRLAGWSVKAIRPTGPKETRAAALSAQAEAGHVFIKPADWNKSFKEELGTFPLGSHDDQVDAASDAFHALIGGNKAPVLEW
jgi:predicted phage terminase large subunit-like protein